MDYVKTKIEASYQLALSLGLENCSELEKKVFKGTLFSIASSAIDSSRNQITDLMSKNSHEFDQP